MYSLYIHDNYSTEIKAKKLLKIFIKKIALISVEFINYTIL